MSDRTAYLIALDSSFSHRQYLIPLSGAIVGRDAEQCDIVAVSATISRRHCVVAFRPEEDRYQIIDQNSTNGLFINGRRVKEGWLEDKDLIGLGSEDKIHLRFQLISGKTSWKKQLPCQKSWTIGRDADVDISLPFEPTVSMYHAILEHQNSVLSIRDLGSLNGTWLNGHRVNKKTVIEYTDTIIVGSTSFHFELEADDSLVINQLEIGDDLKIECIALTSQVKTGKGEKKTILDDISLSLRSGEFVGILGPSGAGKTSFLRALNGYSPPSSGHVLINGASLYQAYKMFRDIIGYVPQDDILYTELTVSKSLEYLARLRLPPDTSAEQRTNIIDTTLEALGLSQVRDQRIQQLSGGQRKRVSIAAELITRPSILFLDEPTAGLDPCVEEKLMHYFKGMARNGTTVLITTHILYNLDLLDRIIVLSRGKLVFMGKPGEAMAFFKSISQEVTKPSHIFDVLEAEKKIVSHPAPMDQQDIRLAVAAQCSGYYAESKYFQDNISKEFSEFGRDLIKKTTVQPEFSTDNLLGSFGSIKKSAGRLFRHSLRIRDVFSFRAWRILSERHFNVRLSFLNRTVLYALLPFLLAVITLSQNIKGFVPDANVKEKINLIERQVQLGGPALGVQLKTLLLPNGGDDTKSAAQIVYAMQNEGPAHFPVPISVLLMCVMTAVFLGTVISCLEISTERSIYQRERMSHQRIVDYIASKLPFCLLVTSAQCLLFTALCWLDPNLRHISFLPVVLSMICIAWTSVAVGLCISALDPSSGQYSLLLSVLAVLPQLILSGGLGPDFYAGMGKIMRYLADALPARWGLELLFTAVYLDHSSLGTDWIPAFVTKEIGFGFGSQVYWRSASVLLLQATSWISLCVLLLLRRDTVR